MHKNRMKGKERLCRICCEKRETIEHMWNECCEMRKQDKTKKNTEKR